MGLSGVGTATSDFYDRWTELFQRGFGSIFQAGILRTGDPPREDPAASVLALAKRAGIQDGDRILDAGCGIAGPASIIASRYPNVLIDGVTNSARQIELASQLLEDADLLDRVALHLADFQDLPFDDDSYDLVLFLESTGYAEDLHRLYGEAARVLRPEGLLYVKDVFRIAGPLEPSRQQQMVNFDDLWGYRSKSISECVAAVEEAGLVVTRSGQLDDVGTARLAGSMLALDLAEGVRPTEMGRMFAPRGLNPPIEFGEICATKPPAGPNP